MNSWEKVAYWYDKAVGKEGHHYHKNVILPQLLPMLSYSPLLDLGCGQGILEKHAIVKQYVGIDVSPSLIAKAKKSQKHASSRFLVADVTKKAPSLPLFDQATFILSLQNMTDPQKALAFASSHLREAGSLFLVLNHPCFRIPRQSGWGVDEGRKMQYRRVDRYLHPLKIPIEMQPGKSASCVTYSHHFSLSTLSGWLAKIGFCIVLMEEWISDKKSHGPKARMENRAREEFPLFLLVKALKSFKSRPETI